MQPTVVAGDKRISTDFGKVWRSALAEHWPEYLMEGAELAIFMISACLVVALLEHPRSPLHEILPDPFVRRVLIGVAMGLTAVAIVYSPIGKQSGAHFNPSVTLTFWRLGKIGSADAIFYVVAQFFGAAAGVMLSQLILGTSIADPGVNFVATVPGSPGVAVAFAAEVVISFLLMTVVLVVSSLTRLAAYTGLCCGILVATYIAFEAPLSGMSMNPARTFGSGFVGAIWSSWWIYFTAPPLGMLLAAEAHLWSGRALACAKLHHDNSRRCIFCGFSGANRRG